MSVGRRGVLGLGAFGVGSVALGGCGSTMPKGGEREARTGADPLVSMDEVDRLLDDHDRVMAHLGAMSAGQTRPATDGTAGDVTCSRLLEAVCLMGTYRDVPHAAWRHPDVGSRMAHTFPRLRETLAAARQHLEDMGDADGVRIDEKLREEPDLPVRVLERIDEQARRIGVPMDQRVHMRLAVTQLSSRLRYEGTKEVTSGLVAKYDRALRNRLRALQAKSEPDATVPPPDPAIAQAPAPVQAPVVERPRGWVGESCSSEADCDTSLVCSAHACKFVSPLSKQQRVLATTKKTAIVGLYLLIPPLCGIGVLVLITCLFMTIVASALPDNPGER